MKMPSASQIGERFVKFAPARFDRFKEGIRNPGKDWATETKAAEPNYEAGIKEAMKRKAFGKAVAKVGTAKQQAKTIQNEDRWVDGIQGAEQTMATAMEPVVAVMEGIKLPPAYPKGDPRNYDRVRAVGTALRKAKEEGKF